MADAIDFGFTQISTSPTAFVKQRGPFRCVVRLEGAFWSYILWWNNQVQSGRKAWNWTPGDAAREGSRAMALARGKPAESAVPAEAN